MGFLYYVLNAVSIALGKGGMFPPLLAASLPYLIGAGYSLYLIKRLP
jgi:lipopolysaccharide export LptBFGC system permease protein LptF